MTTQHNSAEPATPPQEAPRTWGAPVPAAERPKNPWSTRKIVISAAVAVVIVAGGTIGVIAATNSGSTTAVGPGGGNARFGGGRFGPGGGIAAVANALHGDFVVSLNGAYVTDRLQTGTVSSISATDLTVKSADGYTQTYVINSGTTVDTGANTIKDVVQGNTVTVVAALSGSTATANTIEDTTLGGSPRGGFGGPPPGVVPQGN
jgi:hypothetical protein